MSPWAHMILCSVPGAHAIRSRARSVPGAHAGSHCYRSRVRQALPPLQASHHLHQSWRAAKTSCKNICRHPGHCEGLAVVGGPRATNQVPQPHCDHHLKTRHCSLVWVHQTSGSVGANSPLGRPPGRGLWKESRQVRGTCQRVSTSWMESKVSPNRGRNQGLCVPIPVQSLQSVRHRWSEEEKSYL